MSRTRKVVATAFMVLVFAGTATPASAIVRVSDMRGDRFCIEIDPWQLLDPPLEICIPLI